MGRENAQWIFLHLFEIVRDRFQQFQQCILKGEQDHLIIDRVRQHLENVKRGEELNEQIQEQLKQLRDLAMSKEREKKSGKQ